MRDHCNERPTSDETILAVKWPNIFIHLYLWWKTGFTVVVVATDQFFGRLTDVFPLWTAEAVLAIHNGPQHIHLLTVPERGTSYHPATQHIPSASKIQHNTYRQPDIQQNTIQYILLARYTAKYNTTHIIGQIYSKIQYNTYHWPDIQQNTIQHIPLARYTTKYSIK